MEAEPLYMGIVLILLKGNEYWRKEKGSLKAQAIRRKTFLIKGLLVRDIKNKLDI